jgi:hypothetical protein
VPTDPTKQELEKQFDDMSEQQRTARQAELSQSAHMTAAMRLELEALKEYNEEAQRRNGIIDKGAAAALGLTGVLGALGGEYDGVGKAARGMFTFMSEAAQESINLNSKNAKTIRGLTADYRSLNDSIGGLNQEVLASGRAMDPFAAKARGFLSEINMAQAGMGEANVSFTNALGETNNSFDLLFENTDKITDAFLDLNDNVINENAKALMVMSEKTMNETIILQKALKLNSEETSALINREFAFTGEATTNTLEQVASTSVELAKATGVPMEQIKERTLDIMQATETFGDIGVDSAARIATAISQLGVDFQTFESMTKGFMNFDDAASKMGDLSAMFGIQMDAMEMTYLASEDQEEFLFRMREEVLDAGLDVENMSKARQRMLTDQLGLKSIEQMRTFMREGELGSQEQMEAATDSAKGVDGMTAAMQNFADTTEGATRDANEMIKSRSKAAADYSIKQYSRMEIQTANTAAAVQKIKFTDKQFENFDMFAAKFEEAVMQPQQVIAEHIAGTIQAGSDMAAEVVGSLGDVYNRLGNATESIPEEVEVNHAYETSQVKDAVVDSNEPLRQEIENDRISRQKLEARVDALVTSLAQSETNISLNLNGQVLGEVVGQYVLNNNVTNAAGESLVVGGG